jgi:general secretion pathway protein A
MYRDFYNLRLKPFQISTDPRFLWLGDKHQEALAVLKYGIMDNKGFLLLTGDVGTGKTTLLNALVQNLGEDVLVAMVADPGLAKMDFFNFIADSFGINQRFRSKGEFLIYLRNFLLGLHQRGKQVLLIIDECQNLNQKMLEEVRLLSNIEMADTKLINIFFVGQSEFNNIILRPQNRALRQRITINYNITALSEGETQAFIRFRMGVAGCEDDIFTPRAVSEIYRFSNGYPRLINIVCDQALLTGFVKEQQRIDEKIVAECAEELKIPYGRSIAESDATPEARYVKGDPASRIEKPLTALYNQLQTKSPLAIALVVIIIIWAGLVTAFIINLQHPTVIINPASKTALADKASATVAVPEPLRDAIRPPAAEGNGGPKPTSNSAPGVQAPAPAMATNSRAAVQSSAALSATDNRTGLTRAQAGTALTDSQGGGQRVSLMAIQKEYGIYPSVHFGIDSNKLDDKGYEVLNEIARFCVQNPETLVVLRGYTDRSGIRAYNMKLSEFRANIVKSYLVGRGVKPESITTIAVGPDQQGPGGTTVPFDGHRRKVVLEIVTPTG